MFFSIEHRCDVQLSNESSREFSQVNIFRMCVKILEEDLDIEKFH